ncbi:NAD(P)-dependent oxidoreductase [Nakamurella leprariae]|uniref:NAD(P)H-binding protein n=1 Tax=Nakamurella leprariae TaxID=2803911 RepID=A0A938Y8D7_9ACTN|nr:NAD(P)H-binding protein [Nakamurella leprariae]MBM9467911.1 NAD(P)H-binding protein [Nakamurella leprariae]
MRVTLIGATGFVGSHLLGELLDRGHDVVALVRDPARVQLPSQLGAEAFPSALTLVTGDATSAQDLARAAVGTDVVVSAFNAGWDNPELHRDFLAGSRAIGEGVAEAGVDRYVVIGGAGSLRGPDGTQLVDGPDFPAAIKPGATAARDYLVELADEPILDWTYVSPAVEMGPHSPGERRGSYRLGDDEPVLDAEGRSRISVQDLAVAVVDELENPAHSRRRFTVGY